MRLYMKDIKEHIKECNRLQLNYNWLGFVENKDLSAEVMALFHFVSPTGSVGYDWVNGNEKLKQIVERQK